ncbi:MAG: VacB/RNase II family 3'-5' exoribonuclease, partial [Elusimicrobia bacterium]|nr:VacB/RNase II family 3'-5' exoribonuclease [Elusimicrobiota bacterium]
GVVQEVLGRPGEPRVRLEAVLRTRELPVAFPADVSAESSRLPSRVEPQAWAGRRSFIDVPVMTIDGADAKDFDDALSIEPLGGGRFRVGVHIADVSHYVRPGSALDREARLRATSVYLPDRVVPMLPPALSDDLCSLRPEVERLTLSCLIDLDSGGRVLGARFVESVIRSWRRFTYEEAQEILEGRRVAGVPPRVHDALRTMGPLALALTRARLRRGALDFTLPEHKVVVAPDGAPLRVEKRPRLASHRLIEEFMLAANEATARELKAAGAPLLHRIHEDPEPVRLIELARELQKLGIQVPSSIAGAPARALQQVLSRAQGHPLEETINFLCVRSLRQAVYSEKGAIHFGLGSSAYTHFTSPIRRYPDLFNHRAIRALLHGRSGKGRGRPYAQGVDLAGLAVHCSERERLAAEAERQGVDILRAELLRGKVGQTLDALVTKLTPAGLLVALPDSGAVGLVRGSSAGRVGDRVKVRLDRVHEGRGELDFSLLSPARR